MKIIRQTDTSIEIRVFPTDTLIWSLFCIIMSLFSIIEYTIELNALGVTFWLSMLVWSIYIFLFSSHIKHYLADYSTQTLHISERDLVRIKIRQKYFFREISNLEICETKGEDGWEYFSYLNLKSGKRIDLAQASMRNLETSLRPLAKLINCPYNFVPQEKSFLD